MSASVVYEKIRATLNRELDPSVDPSTRERLALLVAGVIKGKSAAPAQIAKAVRTLGFSDAKAESIERRVRRIENDPELSATLCLHPMARAHLALGNIEYLFIGVDATTKEDEIVMLAANIWYRGRTLPLGWVTWPGNTPLKGDRFWKRVSSLLDAIAPLLPHGAEVILLADRAFGTPAFTESSVRHAGFHGSGSKSWLALRGACAGSDPLSSQDSIRSLCS